MTNSILVQAYHTLKEIAPGHDPLAGHCRSDTIKGSSRFKGGVIDVEGVLSLAAMGHLMDIRPGFGGAVVFVYTTQDVVGVAAHTEVLDDEDYELRMHHGCLQPFGEVQEITAGTHVISIVLTPEQTKNGLRFALASCYPGLPDEASNEDREGLHEGQLLSAMEVRRRGLRPKQA